MATYNEIADCLSKIFRFFIKIGYISEADVSWPGATDRTLDVELCKKVGISDPAIDLIKKIPWLLNFEDLSEMAASVSWSDEWAIEASRYPIWSKNEENWNDNSRLDGSCVALTFGVPGEGKTVFIDANSGR